MLLFWVHIQADAKELRLDVDHMLLCSSSLTYLAATDFFKKVFLMTDDST